MKVRQKIYIWTLLTVLFVHSFGVNVILSLYTADQPLFIELFCVNKDKPQMHCNGSCMLSKLNKQESQESNEPILPITTQFQFYFYVQHIDFNLNILNSSDIKLRLYHQSFYDIQYLNSIFRPPILV